MQRMPQRMAQCLPRLPASPFGPPLRTRAQPLPTSPLAADDTALCALRRGRSAPLPTLPPRCASTRSRRATSDYTRAPRERSAGRPPRRPPPRWRPPLPCRPRPSPPHRAAQPHGGSTRESPTPTHPRPPSTFASSRSCLSPLSYPPPLFGPGGASQRAPRRRCGAPQPPPVSARRRAAATSDSSPRSTA